MYTLVISIVLLFVFSPIIIIYLEGKYALVKKIGAVLICYALGVVVGNIGILPKASVEYTRLLADLAFIPFNEMKAYAAEGLVTEADTGKNMVLFLQDTFSSITILLCLPLILFSLDVKKWFKMAGSAFTSLAIGLFTVLVMIFLGYWIFRGSLDEAGKVAGMLVGVYTGGTPNMAAIKTALNVSQEVFILTHTYEMMLGAIYLVFIFSIGQRVFLMFLPPFKTAETGDLQLTQVNLQEKLESYKGFFRKDIIIPLVGAFILSGAILGASRGISMLLPEKHHDPATVILVTTFGILFSFVPRINQIQKTFQLGMYLILIFCVSVASMADVSKLANISLNLFYFVGFAMFGSHILHAIIAKFFKIDADTVIISGSALICSPPFVPVVASALKNREVIMTGLIVGIAGYAVGNFLGVTIGLVLR